MKARPCSGDSSLMAPLFGPWSDEPVAAHKTVLMDRIQESGNSLRAAPPGGARKGAASGRVTTHGGTQSTRLLMLWSPPPVSGSRRQEDRSSERSRLGVGDSEDQTPRRITQTLIAGREDGQLVCVCVRVVGQRHWAHFLISPSLYFPFSQTTCPVGCSILHNTRDYLWFWPIHLHTGKDLLGPPGVPLPFSRR